MRKIIFLLLSFSVAALSAQNNRYRFAQSYFGFESELIIENNNYHSISSTSGSIKKIPSSISPRILMGGTHFWGHADFYISIPISTIQLNSDKSFSLSNGVLTGFRLLPKKIDKNTIRPYFGIGFNNKQLQLKSTSIGDGPFYSNWQIFGEAGLTYTNKKGNLWEVGMRYFPKNTYDNYLSRTEKTFTTTTPFSFSIAYKKRMDFTAGYSSEKVNQQIKSLTDRAEKEKSLSTYSFGFGWSALIPLSQTKLASSKPFFNDNIEGKLFPEFGLSYYSHSMDAFVRLAFRPIVQKEKAFNYEFKVKKNSMALEAVKFIADYHGFVPFIGPYVSLDSYSIFVKDQENVLINKHRTELGYGITFGWDIRLSPVDFIILRTNLRYTPELPYTISNYKFTSHQLEFNFIQLVFYPERFKLYQHKK